MIRLKMTKSTASFICFIMMFSMFQSCEKNDRSVDSDSDLALDLQAPNGELIADNMSSFKEKVAFVIEDRYGERKEFKIVKLEFLPDIPQGYVANIEYETYDGFRGSYFRVHGLKEYSITDYGMLVLPDLRPGWRTDERAFYCRESSNRQCNKCKMTHYDTPKGIQFACLCDDGLDEDCDTHMVFYY
jgi:hypothetical protein